jgi:ribosomal protein S27AE
VNKSWLRNINQVKGHQIPLNSRKLVLEVASSERPKLLELKVSPCLLPVNPGILGFPLTKPNTRGENQMPTTGEKPGKGTYYCTRCGTSVTLDDDTDTLPPCRKCHGTEFK